MGLQILDQRPVPAVTYSGRPARNRHKPRHAARNSALLSTEITIGVPPEDLISCPFLSPAFAAFLTRTADLDS